ncbi:MAG: hypothetical protein WA056_04410 [Gallionella sp.]
MSERSATMKYVPSLPPPRITGVGESLTVSGPAAVKAAKPVRSRTLPPLVVEPHERREPERELVREASQEPARESTERRQDAQTQGERRTYCRRLRRLPVLFELRAGLERRRHKQRTGDQTEHIDIEA